SVRSSVPEILTDAEGRALFPSVVRYLATGEVETGYAARDQQADDTLNTIASVKRLMGRSLEEARTEGSAYEFDNDDQLVRIRTVQGAVSPIEVSSRILTALRERAEA